MRIKHFYWVLITCLMINTVSRAQAPTITSAALPPITGVTYNYISDTNHIDLPTFTVSAGSAVTQNWDYSANFVTTYSDSAKYLAHTLAYNNLSCTYNQITCWPGGADLMNQYGSVFYNSDTTGLVLLGYNYSFSTGWITHCPYNPNKILIPTPFTFGDTLVDTVTNDCSHPVYCGPCSYTESRQRSISTFTADAFGTLKTPAGTFPNTLRIKIFERNRDSVQNSSPSTGYYSSWQVYRDSSVSYVWLQNNSNFKLMEINMDGTGALVKKAYYEQSASFVDVKNYKDPDSDVSLFPNPNNGTFVIQAATQEKTILKIFDLMGKEVKYENLDLRTGKVTVNANFLPEGIYNVQLSNGEGSINKKLVILK